MVWVSSKQLLIYRKNENNEIIFSVHGPVSLKTGSEETNFRVEAKINSIVGQITLKYISKYEKVMFEKKDEFLTARP